MFAWCVAVAAEAASPLDAMFLKGSAKERADSGDFVGAIEELNEALLVDPKDASALAERAPSISRIGEFDQAVDDYTRAIVLNPTMAEVYDGRGQAWRKGNWPRALADYTKAIELSPERPRLCLAWKCKCSMRDIARATSDARRP